MCEGSEHARRQPFVRLAPVADVLGPQRRWSTGQRLHLQLPTEPSSAGSFYGQAVSCAGGEMAFGGQGASVKEVLAGLAGLTSLGAVGTGLTAVGKECEVGVGEELELADDSVAASMLALAS